MQVEQCSGSIISIPFGKHKIDALYYFPLSGGAPGDKDLCILRLHGILGNLLDETEHELPHYLAQEGYASLTMNTLLANLGLYFGFGIFENVMPQIEAACVFLRKAGFKNIVVAGHGLGGCMAVRYASMHQNHAPQSAIQGLIAIATAYSLPDTIRRRWERFQSNPTYEEMLQRASRIFHAEPGTPPISDETVVIQRAHGVTTLPHDTEVYTLKTWWALAGPEAEGPKAHLHIAHIEAPLLLIQGLLDTFVEPQEATDLASIARRSGNPDVTQAFLDAPHSLEGKHQELGQRIVQWLRERF